MGRETEGDEPPAVADLAGELRALARLRSPSAVKQAELPALRAVCGDDLAGCVDRAIAAISETKYRAAAQALLGSGDGRWDTLERRGQLAAEAFGLTTYDAFRKPRRSTTTSHRDETLELVAESMLAQPMAPPTPGADGHVATDEGGGRLRSRRLAAVAVLAVLLAGGLGAVMLARSSGNAGPSRRAGTQQSRIGRSSPEAAKGCSAKVGDLPAAAPPELSRFVAPFHSVVAPSRSDLCAAAPIERWQNLILQRLQKKADGARDGAVIGADPRQVLRLTEAEYNSYRQFGGRNGERAQAIAGLPVTLYTDHRASILRTNNGGMVSEGRDQPGYYVGNTVWDTWQAGGGATSAYGLATSNPLFDGDGYRQDFEHGTFFLPFNGTLRWQPVPDPASGLPPDPVGHILRHDDGTTWFVDRQRRRHWIPDGDTWVCLTHKGATQIDGVPGYATATLELGAPATCS